MFPPDDTRFTEATAESMIGQIARVGEAPVRIVAATLDGEAIRVTVETLA